MKIVERSEISFTDQFISYTLHVFWVVMFCKQLNLFHWQVQHKSFLSYWRSQFLLNPEILYAYPAFLPCIFPWKIHKWSSFLLWCFVNSFTNIALFGLVMSYNFCMRMSRQHRRERWRIELLITNIPSVFLLITNSAIKTCVKL